MARLTTLVNLRTMLKAAVGASLSVGTQKDTIYNQLLSDMQRWLASEYDFPFLEDRWDVTAGVGAQFVAMPSTAQHNGATTQINFERPVKLEQKWNQKWEELDYGIGSEEYNSTDSDAGTTQDPVQRWAFAGEKPGSNGAAGTLMFEVWPRPATPAVMRFTAQRAVDALAADTDEADLDDLLIVLFVAAELTKDQAIMGKATQRLMRLRAVYPDRVERYIVGSGGGKDNVRRVPIKILAVHG